MQKDRLLKLKSDNPSRQKWASRTEGVVKTFETQPVEQGGRKLARFLHTTPRLIKALQRMLDESNGRGVSHQAKVEARAALQAAWGKS